MLSKESKKPAKRRVFFCRSKKEIDMLHSVTEETTAHYKASFEGIQAAQKRLKPYLRVTDLSGHANMSFDPESNILLKREDQHEVRSFKIRGALNKILTLTPEQRKRGVVCASAGNHSQGVAFACQLRRINCTIVMPCTTPAQKVEKAKAFGGEFAKIVITGQNFDEACAEARQIQKQTAATFIHPFDDPVVIEGQGTAGIEILEQSKAPIDNLIVPIGGGGLISGLALVFAELSPNTKIIGVEPAGAASMSHSLNNQQHSILDHVDPYVDGASTLAVGKHCFEVCQTRINKVLKISEEEISRTLLWLYQDAGLMVELAGALSISAAKQLEQQLRGQNTICVLSGSNNDLFRFPEIIQRANYGKTFERESEKAVVAS